MGPLFFCLAWQRVVRQLPPELVFNSWFLDDGRLVGTWAQLEATLAIIQPEGARLGVCLNTKKCQVWGLGVPRAALPASGSLTAPPLDGMFTSLAAVPQVPWAGGHGLKVLGLPVEYPGSSTFRQGKPQEVVDSILQACHIRFGSAWMLAESSTSCGVWIAERCGQRWRGPRLAFAAPWMTSSGTRRCQICSGN